MGRGKYEIRGDDKPRRRPAIPFFRARSFTKKGAESGLDDRDDSPIYCST